MGMCMQVAERLLLGKHRPRRRKHEQRVLETLIADGIHPASHLAYQDDSWRGRRRKQKAA